MESPGLRPRGARSVLVAIAALALAGVQLGLPGIAFAGTTTLTTCDETSLKSAVAVGGTVFFGVDCTITLTSPVLVGTGLSVDIESNGHVVAISGGNATR